MREVPLLAAPRLLFSMAVGPARSSIGPDAGRKSAQNAPATMLMS
jgi:hypothetical protein